VNKYAKNRVYVDKVQWSYDGAFTGKYSGKVIKSIPLIDTEGEHYSGYLFSNEFGGGE